MWHDHKSCHLRTEELIKPILKLVKMMADVFQSHKSEWELYIDKTGLVHHDNTNRSEVFQKMPQNNVMSTLRSPSVLCQRYMSTLRCPSVLCQRYTSTLRSPSVLCHRYISTLRSPSVLHHRYRSTLRSPSVLCQRYMNTLRFHSVLCRRYC